MANYNRDAGSMGMDSPYDQVPGQPASEEQHPSIDQFASEASQQPPPPPPQPAAPQQPPPSYAPKTERNLLVPIIGIIIVLAVIGGGYYAYGYLSQRHQTTTVTGTITIAPTVINLASCTNITSPGTYALLHNITTKIGSGACIDVKSDNVYLEGNGNGVQGNGPFVGVPPFTYAILLDHVTNVTVTDISLSSFSYGIYLNGSDNNTITNSTVQKMTLSGILLKNSKYNLVSRDKVGTVASKQGGIALYSGGDNLVLNNSVIDDAYYGFVINSSGNTFYGSSFLNNPVDLLCNRSTGYTDSDKFSNSDCLVNDYCNFASCAVTNTPTNISTIRLQPNVLSCGGIYSPGTYSLAASQNMNNYINTSNPLTKDMACITIFVPNVKFNCDSYTISNASYGIEANNQYNVSISGCNLVNDTYGIYMNSTFDYNISNTRIRGSTFALYSDNSTRGFIVNTTVVRNTYGSFVGTSTGLLFDNLLAENNTYGVYLSAGGGEAFSKSTLLNNVKYDMYCTGATYNSTSDIFQSNQCGTTDCLWGSSCTTKVPPPLKLFPLTGCTSITHSGNYSLDNNIANGPQKCFNIKANNVTLNCNGHLISGSLSGDAIYMSGVSNVTVSGCSIGRYTAGVNVSNSQVVTLQGISIQNATVSVALDGVSYASVLNTTVTSFYGTAAYWFSHVSNSVITNDRASLALGNASAGVVFVNSTGDLVDGDNVSSTNGDGFSFESSNNNNVFGDTSFSNSGSDYYCTPDSSGIYANKVGVNYGSTKSGCVWLVEENPRIPGPECYAISKPTLISFTTDFVYPYGSTCYKVFNSNSLANSTTINCNGHTILASHGGTFLDDVNTTDVEIENCNLLNFTTAVEGSAPQLTVLNNTIGNANTSILVTNTQHPMVDKNFILNSTAGIVYQNVNYGQIEDNNFTDTGTGIELVGGTGDDEIGNYGMLGQIGMYLIGATTDLFQNNRLLTMSKAGILCTQSSVGTNSLNLDQGGNVCSSNSQCEWMTTSTQCSPS